MAASLIVVQQLVNTGLAATYEAANVDGNFFTNNGKSCMHIKNGSAVSITATLTSQKADNFGITHNEVVTVPATSEVVINYMSKKRFNDTNGYVQVAYSAITTVTVAVLRMVV
jgi:hypothetical protein